MTPTDAESSAAEQSTHTSTWTCVTCGQTATDEYCSHCGEKRRSDHETSIRHMLSEAIEAFFHLDSKVFLSLRTLLTKPGELTVEYFRGKRKPYMAPLQLFLVCNLIFFVLQPFTGLEILAPPLRAFENNSFLQGVAFSQIEHKLEQKHITRSNPELYAAFVEKFEHTSRLQARTLILAMVPMLAVLLTVLYGALFTKNRKRYFVEHLIFALHAYAWWLLWILGILTVMLVLLVLHLISVKALDVSATLLEFPGLGVYMFLALRRYYKGNLLADVFRGIILAFGVYGIFSLYRIMLLFTILRAI